MFLLNQLCEWPLQFTFRVVIFSEDLVIIGRVGVESVLDEVTAQFVTFRIGLFSWKIILVTKQNFNVNSEKRK